MHTCNRLCFHAVVPEGRCVNLVMTPRETLRPPLIKHSIVYILYVQKNHLEQMEWMPKEQLF